MNEFDARHRKSYDNNSMMMSHTTRRKLSQQNMKDEDQEGSSLLSSQDSATLRPALSNTSSVANGLAKTNTRGSDAGSGEDESEPTVATATSVNNGRKALFVTPLSRGNSSNRYERRSMGQFDIDGYDEHLDRIAGLDEYDYRTKKKFNSQWFKSSLISVLFMVLWYIFSLTISVYNKWMFSADHLNFKFPILTTSGHQLVQFTISCLVVKLLGGPYQRLVSATLTQNNNNKPADEESGLEENDGFSRLNRSKNQEEEDNMLAVEDDEDSLMLSDDESDKGPRRSISVPNAENPFDDERNRLTRSYRDEDNEEFKQEDAVTEDRWSWFKSYIRGVIPTATASGADIGLGNASLSLVSLSFYTMVKSSSLGFVLLFGILFKLEVPTWNIFAIIGVMSAGVVMMVAGEAEFQLVGFFLVLGAAMFSGLRWSLTQLLLRGDQNLNKVSTHNDPIKTIMYLTPPMGIFLFLWGSIFEGIPSFIQSPLWKEKGFFGGVIIMMIPGMIAFMMTLSEFFLLNRTSVLTLSIAGIFKELLTLAIAAIYFGDKLSLVNTIGLVTTLCAIIWYNIYRFRSN